MQEEERFPNWFCLARRELLADLPTVDLPPTILEATPMVPPGRVGVVKLRGNNPLRYLVLTDDLEAVERHVEAAARHGQDDGFVTEPLSDLVYVRPVVEQYLTITGRTYFKGMAYSDIRRLQFDFETTGLGIGLDRIFMVSIKDSDGFSTLLDTTEMDEAELLRRLVRIIRERDPDVIENHNIFDFDIRCLIKRAEALGVPLPLGRDGTGFHTSRDSVKVGARSDGFRRYSLSGREIVDTLHATRRFRAVQRDLRSAGLKEAARYFGFAADDREYVRGADIWRIFQEDPERIRRYCMDDVEEVDGLSRLLLAPSFALASMVPKPFERIATAGTGQGIIEPLLVRAYLAQGHALPRGQVTGPISGGHTAVFTTGVVEHVVKADVASLYPSIMLTEHIAPASDELGAFLGLLGELTRQRLAHKRIAHDSSRPEGERAEHDALQTAMKVLINSFYGTLGAGFALFCDTAAAERVTSRGREILRLLLEELDRRGATLIEADTDGVLFSMPPREDGHPWTYEEEQAFVEQLGGAMPVGIQVEHDGRYRAMYSYLEKNYALLDYPSPPRDGVQPRDPIRLIGVAFRSSKMEPLIERFLAEILRLILTGDYPAVRARFRAVCAALRRHEVPVADLCVSMPLTKTPQTYSDVRQHARRREEPYEVYLAAGHEAWKPGQRVSYYQTRAGKRLFVEGATDYDPGFYINRLRATCHQRLEKAFAPADLDLLFSEMDGLFDPPLRAICPLRTTERQLALPLEAQPAPAPA